VQKEDKQGRKAQRGDEQHNHGNLTRMWKGNKRGGDKDFWFSVAWESNS